MYIFAVFIYKNIYSTCEKPAEDIRPAPFPPISSGSAGRP